MHAFEAGVGVDAVAVAQHGIAAGRQGEGVLLGEFDELGVGPGVADQADIRGLAEGQAELGARHGGDHGLVHVLHGLDEVRLPQNQVQLVRVFELHDSNVHRCLHERVQGVEGSRVRGADTPPPPPLPQGEGRI